MNQKTILLAAIVIIIISVVGLYFFTQPKKQSSDQAPGSALLTKETAPSETNIEYTDPAGFSFNYPDNLSIENKKIEDSSVYTDLQLFSKDVSGSLNLKIADSKFKTLDDWLNANNIPSSITPEEKTLGDLKALEVKTKDRLMLASLDQGVLFTVEIPLIEQDFWNKVYEKVLADFTFTAPDTGDTQTASTYSETEVIFEGEEIVE